MAAVTAAYTIDRYKRNINDIVFEGKEVAVKDLVEQVKKRGSESQKEGVALMDGEPKLRTLIATYLPSFCIILDLYHVLEYLWKAVYVFYPEGTEEANRWVQCMLRLLLQGKVEEIILYLKGHLAYTELTKAKREVLEKVVGYLDRGKAFMKYDYYLSRGYPIGSGVVEGACRNLVKDRMELVGMRWIIPGAESML